MTLIVGIKCRDGVVMGADGAATLGSMGKFTVRQSVKKKLSILHDKIIIGVSGPVGLGQRYAHEVSDLWQNRKLANEPPVRCGVRIREALWQHQQIELQAAALAAQSLGRGVGAEVMAPALIALGKSDEAVLLQFDEKGSPELATEDLPFASIGVGQSIADPFLAFLRDVFWKEKVPSVSDGIFAALWTIRFAIETNTGGISEPIQLTVLERARPGVNARELTPEEMGEHEQNIQAAKNALKNYRDAQQPEKALPESLPPKPPE